MSRLHCKMGLDEGAEKQPIVFVSIFLVSLPHFLLREVRCSLTVLLALRPFAIEAMPQRLHVVPSELCGRPPLHRSSQNIEVFELKCDANDFRVQGANPDLPDTGLIELRFKPDDIKILDREGQERRRRQSKAEFRLDSLSEILRAVGKYVDGKHGSQLRRLNNCCLSDQDEVEIEYQTRAGDVQPETLSMSAIREIAVNM